MKYIIIAIALGMYIRTPKRPTARNQSNAHRGQGHLEKLGDGIDSNSIT